MPRVPADDSEPLAPARVAVRLATALRRHVLDAAQAGLRAVREILARLPRNDRPGERRPERHAPEPAPRPRAAPEVPRSAGDVPAASLPRSYGTDRLVLLPRDPYCLYAYWDLAEATVARARAEAGAGLPRLVLRAYDVTRIPFDGGPPARFQDFPVPDQARSLYAYVGKPGASFVAEIGYVRADGTFLVLARSQPVWTPRTDQPGSEPGQWMTVAWRERRSIGGVIPQPTSAAERPAAGGGPTPAPHRRTSRAAPSSWPDVALGGAQHGSWSLGRGSVAVAERRES